MREINISYLNNMDVARLALTEDDILAAGQIVAGKRPGRTSDDETILFWHRGLSITDIGLGHAMLTKANSMKAGQVLRFA